MLSSRVSFVLLRLEVSGLLGYFVLILFLLPLLVPFVYCCCFEITPFMVTVVRDVVRAVALPYYLFFSSFTLANREKC